MKAYKIELLAIDFDQLGRDEIKSVLENSRYPNDCISPSAMHITEVDIGPWSDDNPLNSGKTRAAEYARIFPDEASPAVANVWISVSECLPDNGAYVLTCGNKFNKPENGIWVDGAIFHSVGSFFSYPRDEDHYDPTHWMPIPAAPQ